MTQRKKAWYIIGGSVAFLVSILILSKGAGPKPICDPNVKTKTVIVIDHSETVATQTLEAIVERAWKHIDEKAVPGELVTVYDITKQSKTNLKPSFEGCKPRKDGSQYTENVKKVKLDFENFKKKLREELSAPIKETKGPVESPIAQVLIDLSLDDKHFRSTEGTKLLVFSDFYEYTPKFSLYSCVDAQQGIQQFRQSKTGSMERPVFKNVEVEMHIIPRLNVSKTSLQCRSVFWNWFFGDMTCKSGACLTPGYLPG
jgi:hypothetical protein